MANYDLTYEGSRVQGILDTGNSLKDAGYIFRGEATPSTVPGTPTERVAYIGGPGTYTNFGGSITVGAGCICVFKYTGSAWSNQVINTGLSDAISSAINSEATTRSEADTALQNAINSEATTRSEADTALQNAITAINNNIGNGYVFAGVAIPSTSPVTGKVFYLAVTAGTYTNFEDSEETPLAVTAGINILKNTGTGWVLDQVIAIDTEPTQGSANLVKSGGVLNSIIQNGPAFDLSAYNAQGGVLATYADLSAALTALDALPADFKKGGMSFKFVLTSDNKYVQYRLMAQNFTTDVTQWQGVDDEPTAGSQNLVKSGGVYEAISPLCQIFPLINSSKVETELGGIDTSTGADVERSDRARSTGFIPVNGDYTVRSNAPFNVIFYSTNANPPSGYAGLDWIQDSYRSNFVGYIRIIYNISAVGLSNLWSYVQYDGDFEKNVEKYKIYASQKITLESGAISPYNGKDEANANRARSGFIKVNGDFYFKTNAPFCFFYYNNNVPFDFDSSTGTWTNPGEYFMNYTGYIRVMFKTDKISISNNKSYISEKGIYETPVKNEIIPIVVKINNNNLGLDWHNSELLDSDVLTDSFAGIVFPKTYVEEGAPTKIVAMLHGFGGYSDANRLGYIDSAWVAWRERFLSYGYAVMDINGYGIYDGETDTNRPWGNFGCVQTIKKAFDYIKSKYNVYEKLYMMGYSMGGQNAISYAMNFPNEVLAVAAFEPAMIPAFVDATIPKAFGYTDYTQMTADNYARLVGYSLLLGIQVYDDGVIVPNGSLSVDFKTELSEHLVCNKLSVPIRIWQGSVGDTVNPNIQKNAIKALRNAGCTASLRMVDGANHAFFGSSNAPEWLQKECIYFFERY